MRFENFDDASFRKRRFAVPEIDIDAFVQDVAANATADFQSSIDAGDATVAVTTETTVEVEVVAPVEDPLDPTQPPTTTTTPGPTTAVDDCVLDQFTDTIVVCDGGILEVAVPVCAIVKGGFDPAAVFMGEDTCTGTIDGGALVFLADNDGCNVMPTVNDTHIVFESTIMTSGGGFSNSVISRRFGLEMDFSCSIEREVVVSIENGIEVNVNHFIVDLGEKLGAFETSMGVFTDDTFTTPIS